MALDEDVLRALYAAAPPQFVAARNELVKGLRREKRRDDATALAALRRPGWDDWALNAVAGSDADVVSGFATAAAEVREAQAAAIEGRDGPDIRTALRDLRDRSGELVRLAEAALTGAGRQATAGEINGRLSQLATNDVAIAQLVAGILGSGDTAPHDLFGGLQPAARTTPATPAKRAAKPSSVQHVADEPTVSKAEQQRRKDALAEANRDHRAAVANRKRSVAAVDRAEGALEQARTALAEAESELATARDELSSATAAEEQADAAVDAARAALDA